MTRETKIGLLVGLAFIIVIGVLLSDHLTTRGELAKAELTQVGDTVRQSSAVPAGGAAPLTPVTVPSGVTPTNTVPTSEELNRRQATSIVQVSGPQTAPGNGNISIDVGHASQAGSTDAPLVLTPPTTNQTSRLGETLIPAAGMLGNPADDMAPVGPNQPPQLAANPTLKSVKAEKGDTLSHMAARHMGANTAANRKAIVDANPSLKANPAKVVLGQTYMIPTQAPATPAPTIPGTTPVVGATDLQPIDINKLPELTRTDTAPKSEPKSKPAAVATYTVKANDTLWKIASTQLGDAGMVKDIQTLNKDLLKGKTNLVPGMTLKLPARTTVASR